MIATATSDEALFAAFRDADDRRALGELVARHWAPAWRLARAVLRDDSAAEDAAQEAFIRTVEAARKKASLDPFAPWLRTVVLNAAKNNLRSSARRQRRERAATPKPGAPLDPAQAVREYAEALPDDLRVPLVLHYGLGFTHHEVA
jgi:RNA polymerase sigma-70 factor (ECF subfamily)